MKRRRILQCARVLHLWAGILTAVYLTLVLVTGLAVNHAQVLRLDKRYLGRVWLPSEYRARENAVRADIAAADLHSGLMFGRVGTPLTDVAAGFCLLLLASGFGIFALGGSVYTENLNPQRRRKDTAPPSPFLVARTKPQRTAKLLQFRNR
ncbi:MAG: hypothetical protein ACE14M_02640 [Terriglobales bacterium]